MKLLKNDGSDHKHDFTVLDVRNNFPWVPVNHDLWINGMPATKVCQKTGEPTVRFSDVTRFLEQTCHELARQLRLPYRDVYHMVMGENEAFRRMRIRMFWLWYGPFETFAKDDKDMEELMALLVLPDIKAGNIDRAVTLSAAAKGLAPDEYNLFIAEVLSALTDSNRPLAFQAILQNVPIDDLTAFVQDVVKKMCPQNWNNFLSQEIVSKLEEDEAVALLHNIFQNQLGEAARITLAATIAVNMTEAEKAQFLKTSELVPKKAVDALPAELAKLQMNGGSSNDRIDDVLEIFGHKSSST